jgi:hypothetical protein
MRNLKLWPRQSVSIHIDVLRPYRILPHGLLGGSRSRPEGKTFAGDKGRTSYLAVFSVLGGWRIYEGGGGVKGKILVLRFEWRSEQSPSDGAGGMRAQPQFSLDAGAPFPFLVLSERKLTHLSGLWDQDVDSQPGVS